jgi:hypothetical protein
LIFLLANLDDLAGTALDVVLSGRSVRTNASFDRRLLRLLGLTDNLVEYQGRHAGLL